MNILMKCVLALLVAVPSFAKLEGADNRGAEVKANLENLLDSVKDLSPEEVKEMLGNQEGTDNLYAATPAAAVIAAAAMAAYTGNTIYEQTEIKVSDKNFDVKFDKL